eukprot:Skav219179  [mRNA]  locus=scaffold648:492033:492272:- [translate_table: standard]
MKNGDFPASHVGSTEGTTIVAAAPRRAQRAVQAVLCARKAWELSETEMQVGPHGPMVQLPPWPPSPVMVSSPPAEGLHH